MSHEDTIMKNEKIHRAWATHQFTDLEILNALECTHMELRVALVAHDVPQPLDLSPGIKQELLTMADMGEIEVEFHAIKDLADKLATSWWRVRHAVTGRFTAGMIQDAKRTRDDMIIEDLAKGIPQTELAIKYGITQSMISKLNPNPIKKKRGKPLPKETWDELLAQYPRFTVSDLSRMYKVSRASIYSRLNK